MGVRIDYLEKHVWGKKKNLCVQIGKGGKKTKETL